MDTVPSFQQFFGPVLETMSKATTTLTRQQICDSAANLLKLSPKARKEIIRSGLPRYISNAGWACTYLKQAGCLETPKRSAWQITERGCNLLKEYGYKINLDTLSQFSEFNEFVNKKGTRSGNEKADIEIAQMRYTPDELLENIVEENIVAIKSDLLERLRHIDPYEFERICIDVLLAMGYGGSRNEFAEVTKKSGDKGIDGIIKQDELGLKKVYIQAKRWNSRVTEKIVRDFLGALVAENVNDGVIITTDEFDARAVELASKRNIILIDGKRFVELMVKYKVGVETKRTVMLLKVDEDYFDLG